MKRLIFVISALFCLCSCGGWKQWRLASPDGLVVVDVEHSPASETGTPELTYSVSLDGKEMILSSPLGIDRADGSFSSGLKFTGESSRPIDEHYTLKSGKKLQNHDFANETTLVFRNGGGQNVELILRTYNDGVAYRYRFPDEGRGEYRITREYSGFRLPTEGRAWIHPYDWNDRLKPSYEQWCQSDMEIGAASPYEQGWAYPMLFNVDGAWAFVTEAVIDGTYPATHVRNTADGLYNVCFPEKEEVIVSDDPEPVSTTLPWVTPWRVIALGDELADIVETTIVQNLNPPSAVGDDSWIRPGRSTWSWWSNGGSPRNFQTQKEYVDFAASMGWEYTLIDAGWQRMTGGTVEDVAAYAADKGVGVWLWYHSGAGPVTDTVINRNVMSRPEARKAEMARLAAAGIKGIKVDFFDTDKQRVVAIFPQLLADAAANKLMVNLHGASLPRGLERTYPNLMTTEAIKGAEGFGRQTNCDRAAWHNTTVVFTRNVVGSMDYTPVTFSDKVRQGVVAYNRTTYPHQLALSVVFESGVQNFADRRESYESLPEAPKKFLTEVPTTWDETRLVSGFPGDHAIFARRKGDVWWIGGINGLDEAREMTFELPFVDGEKTIDMIVDGAERTEFATQTARTGQSVTVKMAPNGGFAATIK